MKAVFPPGLPVIGARACTRTIGSLSTANTRTSGRSPGRPRERCWPSGSRCRCPELPDIRLSHEVPDGAGQEGSLGPHHERQSRDVLDHSSTYGAIGAEVVFPSPSRKSYTLADCGTLGLISGLRPPDRHPESRVPAA